MSTITFVVLAVIAFVLWRCWPKSEGASQGKLQGAQTYNVPVVGESHYQEALARICGGRTPEGVEKGTEAKLIVDDKNVHDRNAVRVEIQGSTVGYLSRDFAPLYRNKLKKAGTPGVQKKCDAVIRGGWDRGGGDEGLFGVWLDIA